MNLTAKFVFSIGLPGLLCLMLPGSLRADMIYTYTGNPYTSCSGTYANLDGSCSGAVSVTFDVTGNVDGLDNVSGDISESVTSFTFSDGHGLSLSCATQGGGAGCPLYDLFIETNMDGIITYWYMYATSLTNFNSIFTNYEKLGMPGCTEGNCFPSASDGTTISDPSGGSNQFDAGSWSDPMTVTTTPEPSSYLLFGTGLLALLALAARSKRHAPPTSC